jgi:hypothetical protein
MESYRLINAKSDITTPNTSLMPCLPALPACAKIMTGFGGERFQEASAWQSFPDQDPFLPLIGSCEDDAADVSQNTYGYLAGTYRP